MKRLLLIAFAFAMLLAVGSRAVTPGDGPGGVGTTDGSSALELWLKADSLALTNGAPVSNWSDSSGNTRHLVQGSASLQPALMANALGGKPVVRFQADAFGSLTLPSTGNEFAVVAVIKPIVTGNYCNVLEGQGGVRPMLWVDGLGNYEFNFNSGAVTPSSGNYDIVFGIKRSAGPQFSQLYLNGPSVTASGPNSFTIPASQSYTFFNRSGSQAFNGDIAELIVYSTALTEAEINKIGFYLQQKYGLNASFTSPFPVLTGYQQNSATYGVNAPITPNVPTITGGTASGFSIQPGLPAGLNLDPQTGVISGTPTAVSTQTTYTVTAAFPGQPNSSTQISIGVGAPALAGYSREPAIFTRLRPAEPVSPIVRGGPVTGFTISPVLPAGLTIDPQTGIISGVPTATAATAVYTITATFAGFADSSYALSLQVLEPSTTVDITEFMAGNDSTIADGHGTYSDWIEIHNYGAVPIDLAGWSLTDSPGNLREWIFPSRILQPGAYLVVFASGASHVDPAGYLHADFKLDNAGEYLALVQPDGFTIARQFSPAFSAQSTDISFGTRDRVTYGFYSQPTPGAENGFFSASSTTVAASPPSRTFSGTLAVTLSASLAPESVIRYTLNGTAPTAASPIYTTPLSLTATSRLRARVFQTGIGPGPELTEVYLRLGADVQNFSSNLPLVFLHTDGAIAQSSSPTLTGANAMVIGLDSSSGRASVAGALNYAGRGGLRIRGRSSQSFPQKQYKFETWDSAGNEADTPLLGLARSSDWVLNAPWSEKSLIRNALAYRTWENLGRPSLGTRFVEVFLNDDGDGQFTYADDYAGIYLLVEPPKLDAAGISGPQNNNVTGGFLTETGVGSEDQSFTTSASGRLVGYKDADPDTGDLNAAQKTWIRNYITEFETALYGSNFTHPTTGRHYGTYTDLDSQVDYKIIREWSRNFDGGSTYFYVPRGDKLTMGPLWDYNWAFGNVNYAEGGDLPGYRTDGWNRSFTGIVPWAPWWLRMEQDPDWWQLFIDRWAELRAGLLSDAAVSAQIDAMTVPLAQEAAARNFAKWPQLGVFTSISPPGYETRTTYQSEVNYLKNWLRDRSAWIDSQFPARPTFSRPAGAIVSGTSVVVTATAGATIYYTTNGTDPRDAGGAIAAGALNLTSGGSIMVNSSVIVFARVKNGTTWGPPARVAYVTGTPASAQNLIISEIAYHPADPTPLELATDPTLSDDDFEFIEIRNISAGPIDLTGTSFTEGLRFTFPVGFTLAPGAYAAVAENLAAFIARYGSNPNVAGQYAGNLNNSNDTIVLLAADRSEIARVRYSDAWSPAADGAGYTLTLRDPGAVPPNYSLANAWGLSTALNGSPATGNSGPAGMDYSLWQQSTFSTSDLADPQRNGPTSDPDTDGVPNLLEMALCTSPLNPNSRPTIQFLPHGTDFAFTFTRLRSTIGLNTVVESSDDLVIWTAIAAPLEVVSQTSNMETVRAMVPRGTVSNRFVRLRVVR